MAPGMAYYIYRPAEFSRMPAQLVTHTADHYTFDDFAGKRVVVIGGGQSALEMSALLHENGADVDLVARQAIHSLGGGSMENGTVERKLRCPQAGVATGWLCWRL